MSEGNVAIRLKVFIDSSGLTSSQFADICGIPRPSLSQLLSGRNKKISDVLVGMIHNAFPNLSILWLLFGEGSMLVTPDVEEDGTEDDSIGESKENGLKGDNTAQNRGDSYDSTAHNFSGSIERMLQEKDAKIEELRAEIENMRKKPRRVSQITVYYDDSTFETFYPQSVLTRSK